MHSGVTLREERYLERKFGESYLHYKLVSGAICKAEGDFATFWQVLAK
jgi:hypothetical protein